MEPIVRVADGDDNGNVFSFGSGSVGQLGHFFLETNQVLRPYRVESLRSYGVRGIACGKNSSFAVTVNNDLYGWGDGMQGQLAFGEKGTSIEPYLIGKGFESVSSGSVHTLALTVEGDVFSWGDSDEGLTGHNDEEDLIVPRKICSSFFLNKKVAQIECGYFHSACVTVDGCLFTWGMGQNYCLGTGSTDTRRKPVLIKIYNKAQKEELLENVTCGRSHTLVLTVSKEVYGFGDNTCGQVGAFRLGENGTGNASYIEKPSKLAFSSDRMKKGQTEEQILKIAAGSLHSSAISKSGKLYVWGCGTSGQLGLGKNQNQRFPTPNTSIQEKVISVSCGDRHTACVVEDGSVYVWGKWMPNFCLPEDGSIHYSTPYMVYPDLYQLRQRERVFFSDVACGGSHTLLLSRFDEESTRPVRGPKQSFRSKVKNVLLGRVYHEDFVQFECTFVDENGTEDIRLLLLSPNVTQLELVISVARCYKRKMMIKSIHSINDDDLEAYIDKDSEVRDLIKQKDEYNRVKLVLAPAKPELLEVAGLLNIPMSSVANQRRAHTKAITCMVLWEEIIFTSSDDYTIRGWNKFNGTCTKVYEGHSDKITQIILQKHPTKEGMMYLCSCGRDNSVRVWDIESEECIKTFKLHQDIVTQLISLGDRYICSCGVDNKVIIWDIQELGEIAVFEKNEYPVTALIYIERLNALFTGGMDGVILRYDLNAIEELRSDLMPVQMTGALSHHGAISCFGTFQKVLYSGSNDQSIISWDLVYFYILAFCFSS